MFKNQKVGSLERFINWLLITYEKKNRIEINNFKNKKSNEKKKITVSLAIKEDSELHGKMFLYLAKTDNFM